MTFSIPFAAERPRAILFDVDGTLVDTNDLHVAAWRETFLAAGHDIAPDAIRAQVGKGADNLIPALPPGIDRAGQEAIEREHKPIFQRDYLPRAKSFPGVRLLFERLHDEGVAIVLASSSSREEVDFHIPLTGGEDLVDEAVSGDEAARSKPCPDIFEAALAGLSPPGPEGVLVVGDARWDAIAAAGIGLPPIGLRRGGSSDRDLPDAGMIALFDDPAGMLACRAARLVETHAQKA